MAWIKRTWRGWFEVHFSELSGRTWRATFRYQDDADKWITISGIKKLSTSL